MYSDHYGFSERPFQLTPDPRFWFESRTHRKAMSYLGYGLAQGEGFIVITGDIGAGKTTLVGHLLETIDRARFTAVNIVSTQVDGDDMLRLVAQGLGLNVNDAAKAQLLDRVERTLDEQARLGRHVLIIVDESQNLSISALEELRMLSNYHIANRSAVQIVMLGQPEFRDRLRESPDLEQLRQRVIATHHLDPMNPDEIEPYIIHRLNQVGYSDTPEFLPEAFAALYKATGGVPRILNTLMARVLLHGALENLDVIDGETVTAVADDARSDTVSSNGAAIVAPGDPASDRIVMLEMRLAEQEAALRRVLQLLVSWVETEAGHRSDAA
ncbi:MAG: XrtA/PEP-CTERM system-associated ATPase [Sphingomonadaceae bacterium]